MKKTHSRSPPLSIYIYIYTYIYIFTYILTDIYIYILAYIYMFTFMYIYMYLHIYIYVYIHVYIYTYIYMFTYIHTYCGLTTLVTNPASTQAPDGTKGPKPSWKSLLMVLLNLPDDTQRISLTVVKGANPMASKRSRPTERTESKAFFLGSLVPAQPHLGPERLAAMDDPAVRHTNMTTHPGQACDMEDSRKSHSQNFIFI